MRIRLIQLVAALVAAALFVPQPAEARGRRKKKKPVCNLVKLMADLDGVRVSESSVIPYYGFVFGRDAKECKNPESISIEVYQDLNKQINEVLAKHKGCSWDDIPIYKIEKVTDICPTDQLGLVPLVPPKDPKDDMPPVPLVPPPPKCDDAKVSQSVLEYIEATTVLAKTCTEAELAKLHKRNKQLDALLKKHGCTWADFKGLKKVETLADLGCKEPKAVEPKEAHPELHPLPAITITEPPPKPEKSYLLTITGASTAGLGLVLIGVGGLHFGLEADRHADEAHAALIQLDAIDLEQKANDEGSKANILMGIGGGLMAVGAVLVILDLTVWGPPDDAPATPTTSLEVGPGNARLTVRF